VAIYSYPTFSVNKMANGISQLDYEDLINDPDKPFFDRSVAGRYPPAHNQAFGSIHALNRGQISWTTKMMTQVFLNYLKMEESLEAGEK